MSPEVIHNAEDILHMLDSFFREEGQWWDTFYTDRNRGVPFFANAPDENLVHYFQDGRIQAGKVLELLRGRQKCRLHGAARLQG